MDEPLDLKRILLEKRPELTRQQQKLAGFVLENMEEIPFLPVPVLSNRAGVSEATVVRFSKRLGFDGFSGLKSAFVTHLQAQNQTIRSTPKVVGEATLNMVIQQEMDNLKKCAEGNEIKSFNQAASAIAGAGVVHCFGAGASSIFAEYAAYLFSQIGLRAAPLSTRFTSPLEQLITWKSKDLLCCFSFPPYSNSTIALLKAVRKRQMTTVAFCDRLSAPVAQWADCVLIAPCEGMMFTNSMTALNSLINALVTEIGKLNGKRTLSAIDSINKILEEESGDCL